LFGQGDKRDATNNTPKEWGRWGGTSPLSRFCCKNVKVTGNRQVGRRSRIEPGNGYRVWHVKKGNFWIGGKWLWSTQWTPVLYFQFCFWFFYWSCLWNSFQFFHELFLGVCSFSFGLGFVAMLVINFGCLQNVLWFDGEGFHHIFVVLEKGEDKACSIRRIDSVESDRWLMGGCGSVAVSQFNVRNFQ
jgi:hypothetical protein